VSGSGANLPAPRERRPRAVALRYRREEGGAPRVTASGAGPVAERIVELAREHGLPMREDPDLVEALAILDLGAVIPAELYDVIAEVLAWAYRANSAFASTTGGLAP
jgi:flagellar biosynthesis protein